jgi:PAP2 superfamily
VESIPQLLTHRWHPSLSWQAAVARHPALRYVQIVPIGLLLWGLDDVATFRTGAAPAGLRHALAVNSISLRLGGAFGHVMNDWLAAHHLAALAATWYYIILQGALTGVIGVLMIWRRMPRMALHRDALIAVTAIGLATFWFYPVAPPRMLPGYHDVIASAVPTFASVIEAKGADQFASLPSLHVAWAIWGAIVCAVLLRRHRVLRLAVWLYPAATVADVLATANHYLLDVITAPVILLLGYAIACILPALLRRLAARHRAGHEFAHAATATATVWPVPRSQADTRSR